MTEVWLSFLAGLLGSPHCVGMCGGIVAAMAVTGKDLSPGERYRLHLLYNLGRIGTYSILGASAGMLGSSLNLLVVKSYAVLAFAAAHLFVMAIGVGTALELSRFNLGLLERKGVCAALSGPWQWAMSGTTWLRIIPLGMMQGLLPCGMVYAPLFVAAGGGSPLRGAMIMAALGIGTLPLIVGLGTASSALSSRLTTTHMRLVGGCLFLMGAAGLLRLAYGLGYLYFLPG